MRASQRDGRKKTQKWRWWKNHKYGMKKKLRVEKMEEVVEIIQYVNVD